LLINSIWFFKHGWKDLNNGSEKKGKADFSLLTTSALFDVPAMRFIPLQTSPAESADFSAQ
jgi:hypothetical protein